MILHDAAFQWKKNNASFLINNKTEKGKIRLEDKLYPGTQLAVTRTVMANERSLQAFVRTALGCFLGGVSLFKFFGHPAYEIFGIMLMIISAAVLFVGVRKYRTVKKLISDIDTGDWQTLEVLAKKNQMVKG